MKSVSSKIFLSFQMVTFVILVTSLF